MWQTRIKPYTRRFGGISKNKRVIAVSFSMPSNGWLPNANHHWATLISPSVCLEEDNRGFHAQVFMPCCWKTPRSGHSLHFWWSVCKHMKLHSFRLTSPFLLVNPHIFVGSMYILVGGFNPHEKNARHREWSAHFYGWKETLWLWHYKYER